MAYGRKWAPSKRARKEFAEKMNEIDTFCAENGIEASRSSDSYYFCLNGQKYRVSNHTIEASNRGAFDDMGNQTRDFYHTGDEADTIHIFASKTRIIEIYENLRAGKKLDRRGNVVE